MSASDQPIRRFRARVEGRVQGVGFRYFVAQKAEEYGVKGWVRNRWDGTVEIEAEGDVEQLNRFSLAVRKGPRGAFVSDLHVDWGETEGEFKKFEIRQTG